MYFNMKNYLKSTRNHTVRDAVYEISGMDLTNGDGNY